MSDFDQALYDAVMAGETEPEIRDTLAHIWWEGYKAAAKVAARISAERVPLLCEHGYGDDPCPICDGFDPDAVAVSDEDRARVYDLIESNTYAGSDGTVQDIGVAADAICAALAPMPVSDEHGSWWGWNFARSTWFPCLERECRECVTPEGVIVHSTLANRDERRDEVLRAVRAAIEAAQATDATQSH